MIHEIYPHQFHNEFKIQEIQDRDFIIVFNGRETLFKKATFGKFEIPRYGEIKNFNVFQNKKSHYLLQIDDENYFLLEDFFISEIPEGFEFRGGRTFRNLDDICARLGGSVSAHIAHFEYINQYCGICGSRNVLSKIERATICPQCKNTVYPSISPVVIIAITHGDKLLMARNLDNPNPTLFLISGYVEVGESFEQAAHREAFEEMGIRIKNLQYFGSQPWPFSDSMIAGFTAELDGSSDLKIQESEIAEAKWVHRKDIPKYDTSVSISSAMIEWFRNKN